MSGKIISVILVVEADEIALFELDEPFGKRYQFKIEHRSPDWNKALKVAEAIDTPVVVCRVKDPNVIKPFVAKLKEKNIKLVCICKDAPEGFVMLGLGATEFMTGIEKRLENDSAGFKSMLAAKINSAHAKYTDSTRKLKKEYGKFDKIIALGSSTGGTEMILNILRKMPADSPPILIVQHMPPVFTRMYAERMHGTCGMSVWEAQNGDELKRGLVLVAPGDFQMRLEKKEGVYRVRCERGALVSGHCPSVDVLFDSVAASAGKAAVGIILTGMGKDGAQGLLKMRKAGAMTFGQDEETCIVYGMPKEAYDIGAVARQLPIDEIAGAVIDYCKG